jgi:hypothetical protein
LTIIRKHILTALLGTLVLGGNLCAEMMPFAPADSGIRQRRRAVPDPLVEESCKPLFCDESADLGRVETRDTLIGAGANDQQFLQLTTDGQGSLGLCLCALLGLGMCRSVSVVKRFSFGVMSEWYHDGGAIQIGHSHAAPPDCVFSNSVCCFVQPEKSTEENSTLSGCASIISRWRTSQFTPAVLASRGPPLLRS